MTTLTMSDRQRRRLEQRKRRAVRRLRVTMALPALVGLVVIATQITADRPVPVLVFGGMLAIAPWLATWMVRL